MVCQRPRRGKSSASGCAMIIGGKYLETRWWGPRSEDMPALVLLHEGLGCVALWRDFPDVLAETLGCGVFAYSRFGYGGSDPVMLPRPMSYMHDEAIEMLPRVLDAVGATACRADRTLRWRVDRGDPCRRGARSARSRCGDDRRAFLSSRTSTSRQSARSGRTTEPATCGRGLRAITTTWTLRSTDGTTPGSIHGSVVSTSPHRLSRIEVPVLALQGTDDPYGTDEQLRVLERVATCPVTTRLISGARHAPHLEARDATLQAIVPFVRNVLMVPAA